jgi:hypothetical protein
MARATQRPLFTPGAVPDEVAAAYGLDVTPCTLLRSFVNDVYAVVTSGRRHVFKVYRHGHPDRHARHRREPSQLIGQEPTPHSSRRIVSSISASRPAA